MTGESLLFPTLNNEDKYHVCTTIGDLRLSHNSNNMDVFLTGCYQNAPRDVVVVVRMRRERNPPVYLP